MLSCMVQLLLENMETLSLPELTHALRTCFKVLSKVQIPPAYLGTETGSSDTVGILSNPLAKSNKQHASNFSCIGSRDRIVGLCNRTVHTVF